MDDSKQTNEDNMLGAPELSEDVSPTRGTAYSGERPKRPVFRAEPRPTIVEPVSVDVSSVPFDDDDEDDFPEPPPALDESQARIEYLQSLRSEKKQKKRRGGAGRIVLGIFLVFVILGALGASVYFMFHRSRPAPKQQLVVNQPQQTDQQTATDQTQPEDTAQTQDQTPDATTVEPKDYTSSNFKLSLKYPGDWTPTETTAKLSFTSPVLQLTDANGQTISGRIVAAVRQQQAKPAELNGADPVAVLASEKMKYTNPSASQRGETFFTYAQFLATNIKGGLDSIYITGSFGYQYAQKIKIADLATIKPLINVSFVSCADTACEIAAQKPLTISSSAWQTESTNRPAVEAMLQSISLN